jgi:HlyD family secretion protein
MKMLIAIVLVVAIVVGGWVWYVQAAGNTGPDLRTAPAVRGDLTATISATGICQPEDIVDVGAQVAGKIVDIEVDYCDQVREGQLLATIDDAIFKTRVAVEQANLVRAKADRLALDPKLKQAEYDYERAKKLVAKSTIAQSDLEVAETTLEAAKANIVVADAAIGQANASLKAAEVNLNYTKIVSDVNGTIITRRVNKGQTVVAGLNAPSLFLIAKDLKKMQVWVSVNEADISRININQAVRFTVDTYPGKTFEGKVVQMRKNATMNQNVITYTVVVATDNSELKLEPYMTANTQFVIDRRTDVLQVPAIALRWLPPSQWVAPDARQEMANAGRGGGGRSGPAGGDAQAKKDRQRVWVIDGKYVRPVSVKTGLSDGLNTEIVEGDLTADMEVVVGENRRDAGGDVTNPFAPRLFGGQKTQQ